MLPLLLDHLVIAARGLAEGRAWAEARLGVAPGGGGAHPLMGTHNALWRLGRSYLEVIAVDPEAPAPARPRWYGLGDPETRARIAARPRLLTWVVGSNDVDALRAASLIDPGPPVAVTRGDLSWDLTVPEDGRLRFGGLFPSFIRWPDGVSRPPERLPDTGLALVELACHGASETLAPALSSIGADRLIALRVDGNAPRLTARVSTPAGEVVLD